MTHACLLGLLILSASADAQEVRTGTIKSVVGHVTVVRGESRQEAAHPGDGVTEHDRVVTGPDSATALILRDGTAISVGPNSALDLISYQYESTKQEGAMAIHLITGSMRFITGLLGKRNPDRVRISTPSAVIGIRGTDFIVEAQ
jgi:hypothetical protein